MKVTLTVSTFLSMNAASAGASANKFLAKLASDLDKPDGLTVIRLEEARAFLAPMPVEKLWGVGPASAARLRERGFERHGPPRVPSPRHPWAARGPRVLGGGVHGGRAGGPRESPAKACRQARAARVAVSA